jgi:hypothetical protein
MLSLENRRHDLPGRSCFDLGNSHALCLTGDKNLLQVLAELEPVR